MRTLRTLLIAFTLVLLASASIQARQAVLTPGANTTFQGPCQQELKTFVPISQTTGTQLLTGTAGLRTYVCSIHIVTATAQNIALVSGTGTVCATSLGPMAGGTTAATGWNLAANGGLVLGTGSSTVAKSDTDADNVCLLQSSSGQISGTLSYVASEN